MIINTKYIHKVAESEGGEMEAMIHDHLNDKILAFVMDKKKRPL